LEDLADFVADAAEDGELLLLGAGGVGGIIERPVVTIYLAGEDGAGLIGVSADGDDGLHRLVEEFVEVLGGVAGDVDADFGHDFDGEWMDESGWVGSGTGDSDAVVDGGAQDPLGEVASAGVAGAEDEDERLFHERWSRRVGCDAPGKAGGHFF